jgi:hypothetical protein
MINVLIPRAKFERRNLDSTAVALVWLFWGESPSVSSVWMNEYDFLTWLLWFLSPFFTSTMCSWHPRAQINKSCRFFQTSLFEKKDGPSVQKSVQHRYISILVPFDRYTCHLVSWVIWGCVIHLGFEKQGNPHKNLLLEIVVSKKVQDPPTHFISQPAFFKLSYAFVAVGQDFVRRSNSKE